MSFILVSKRDQNDDLQVNGWNWRPTVALLLAEGLLDKDTFEQISAQGCDGHVDAELASRIADVIDGKLLTMKPSNRIQADLTVVDKPKVLQVITPETEPEDIDTIELYSATYAWLERFRDFCRRSGGFQVY